MGSDSSRLRQQLVRVREQLTAQLDLLLEEKGPLIRGSFGSRGRKCGKPTCRCAQGELHYSKQLTATDGGKMRQVHVPVGDEVEVALGVERYRMFNKQRKRLAELAKQQLALVDALGKSLLQPYPPDNPLPPPRRRGRPRGVPAQ